MRRLLCVIVASGFVHLSMAAAHSIRGSWCIDEENIVITFRTGDSMVVHSTADETVNGNGAYTLDDSTFYATVVNGDMTIKLGYTYRWVSDSVISARPQFFIVNNDTAKQIDREMTMRRCAAKVADAAASSKSGSQRGVKGRRQR